jgi:hypothetical protein
MTYTNAPPEATPESPAAPTTGFELSEDWVATFIGLAIVLVIGTGLLGPGLHSVKLTATPGKTVSTSAPALDGWAISVTLDGEEVTVQDAFTTLETDTNYDYTCRDGAITAEVLADIPILNPLPEGQAEIFITNECAAAVIVSYKISSAIPWPVFGLFAS